MMPKEYTSLEVVACPFLKTCNCPSKGRSA
jgi:hypothetical protein